MSQAKTKEAPKFEMPDVDIRAEKVEIYHDDYVKCMVSIPNSMNVFIDRYNEHRIKSGLSRVSKVDAILHFYKIAEANIEFAP